MTDKPRSEEFRCTTVCIDSYAGGVPAGRFYNPCLPDGKTFNGITHFLAEMERVLDVTDFPKAFHAIRSFAKPPPTAAAASPEAAPQTGAVATFTVRILFRQNASWQGSIIWQEGRQEQSFRSVLELILLMDSALNAEKAS